MIVYVIHVEWSRNGEHDSFTEVYDSERKAVNVLQRTLTEDMASGAVPEEWRQEYHAGYLWYNAWDEDNPLDNYTYYTVTPCTVQ